MYTKSPTLLAFSKVLKILGLIQIKYKFIKVLFAENKK